MTPDELYATMAMKAPIKSPEEWADFIAMPPALQEAEAALIKSAIFARDDGSTVWADLLGVLGVAAAVTGDVVGVGSAVMFFRGLV